MKMRVLASLFLGLSVAFFAACSSGTPGSIPSTTSGSLTANSRLGLNRPLSDASASTATPTPTLQPLTPDAPAGTRLHPQSAGGGALIQVSQGAVAMIVWQCATYPSGTPCPSGSTSTWSATAPSGISVNFDPVATTGGQTTTEFFTTTASTPPGTYSADACLQNNYQNNVPICATFLIQVVSSTQTPMPSPPPTGVSLGVKLHISTAGSNGKIIPGQGHLYVELYTNGVPTATLQAGPLGGNLEAMKFTQYPLVQLGVDISQYVTQSNLVRDYNFYVGYQNQNEEPLYNPLVMNSNTWADGLLLQAGMSQTEIGNVVNQLQSESGLIATGYSYGYNVQECFAPWGIGPVAIPATTVAGSGLCTNRP